MQEDIMYKKAIMLVSVMIISAGLTFAQTDPDTTETTGDTYSMISGSVIDADTGDAIPNATVRINETDQSATTDDYGTFVFEDVDSGTYTVSVEADGYESTEQSVDVTEEGSNIEIEVRSEM